MYQLSGGAPFKRDASGAVYDCAGERIKLLGDTMKIIQQITMEPEWADTQIAYVSRCGHSMAQHGMVHSMS
jgi:magnesium-dependent phosphatase 1